MAEAPAPFLDQLRARAGGVPVTSLLVAANLVVFVAMLFAGAALWHDSNAIQLSWGANFGPATKDGEWWRLFSAMFLHFSLPHLAINMAALVEAGRFVERGLGSARFILVYCGGGLAGNLLSLAVQGDRGISGGASGAVFAIFGALLVILWRERAVLEPREFRWLFGGAAVLAGANILLGSFVSGIDNGAHIGGFGFGVLAAIALGQDLRSGQRTSIMVRSMAGSVLAAALVTLFINLPVPAYDWSDELEARNEIVRFLGADADISSRWDKILEQGRREELSFADLAARIDNDVTERYEASFEQLAALPLDSRAPSMRTLATFRRYAELRRDAAHGVADGLRAHDPSRVAQALAHAHAARALAGGLTGASDNPDRPSQTPRR
jgi:rhomboid protease GluP